MKSRSVTITYTLLMLVLIGSTAFLALEVRAYMEDQSNPLDEIPAKPNATEVLNDIQREREQERQTVMFTFNQTTSFTAIATRVPIPTPTMRPMPTPTPPIPAKGYTFKAVMRTSAVLMGYDHKQRVVQVGETIEDAAIGDFEIVETDVSDFRNPKVKVRHVQSGTIGFITERWTGNK